MDRQVERYSITKMLNCCCCAVTGVLVACSSAHEAAADAIEDPLALTMARLHPDLVGTYQGGSSRGTWNVKICADDSIRVTMRAAHAADARTLLGTWFVQGADMGLTDMVFILHSNDGSAIDPPRMRGCYQPPDTIWLRWPGPAWFLDPPGLRWICVRTPEDRARKGH